MEKVNHYNLTEKIDFSMGPSVKFVLAIIDSISKKNDDDDDDDLKEEEASDETEEKHAEKVKEKKVKKTASAKKGFPLKGTIISSITGLILGAITIVVLYILAFPSETPLPETVVELTNKMMKAKLAIEKMNDTKDSKPKTEKTKPKPKTKKLSYLIQVVSCISKECVDESRLQLSSLGFKSRVRTTSVSSGIAEVLSSKVLGDEESAIMVKKINTNNPLAGHAYRKSVKNGFLVSLGMFPDLETANRVRTYLNQAFNKQIFFNIQLSTQKIRYQKIQIGEFKSKKDAKNLSNRLKQNYPDFQGAFVISAVKQ
jgi:cell division septation protein DedD